MPERTFEEISEIWNKKNPDDQMDARAVARVHRCALAKLKESLDETEDRDITQDLIYCLTKKKE